MKLLELFESQDKVECSVTLTGVASLQMMAVEEGDYESIHAFNDHFFNGLNDKNELWFGTDGGHKYIISGPKQKIQALIDYAQKFKKRKAVANLINTLEYAIATKH